MASRLIGIQQAMGLLVLGALGVLGGKAQAAACALGSSGETSVQDFLNNVYPGVSASNCVVNDQTWKPATNPAVVGLVFEFAGYAQYNTFGVYDPLSNATLQIFAGSDGAFTTRNLFVSSAAGGKFNFSLDGGAPVLFSSSQVGFYLGTPNGTFYSENAKNSDGFDHLLTVKLPAADQWLLAWEDLKGGGDRDFNDMGVVATGMAPVPLPAAAWLLLSGLVGVATVARRRKAALVA